MSATLLDGKAIAKRLQAEIRRELERLIRDGSPCLGIIQVGDAPAVRLFTVNQERLAAALGMTTRVRRFSHEATQAEVERAIQALNEDPAIHGIFVQNPLPAQLDPQRISAVIDPDKDVEGISPAQSVRRFFGRARIGSCTALAVMELIEASGVALQGKEAVIIGHSEIVGRPVGMLLLDAMATTTICHAATHQLEEHVRRADILVVAVGQPALIQGTWIKPGAVVVDVGINVMHDGRVVGDVEFASAASRAAFITPVPGGVGPVTVTMVMKNTLEAFKRQRPPHATR